MRHDVTVAEREEGRAAEVEVGREAVLRAWRSQLGAHRTMKKRKSEDKTRGPHGKEAEQRKWSEDAQEAEALLAQGQESAERPPDGPGHPIVEARQAIGVAHAPRQHHRLEC